MSRKHCIVRLALSLILLGLVSVVPALAGSVVVGSVAGSMNATVGGQALLPNTTLFSGDSLQVKDGVAVVALGGASRIVFGRDTAASFLRDSYEVTVLLDQGNVSLFQDAEGTPVRMKIGDVAIAPVSGFKTLGEVAMLNGAVVISAKDGMLRVTQANGQVVNVAKGKTISVAPQAKAPQGAGGGAGRCCGGGAPIWGVTATAAGGAAAILAGVAMSRAGGAKDNSAAAESAAAAAESTAAAAESAAAAAASAAASAASAAAASANAVGCALNVLANQQDLPSPYTPPAGMSCP